MKRALSWIPCALAAGALFGSPAGGGGASAEETAAPARETAARVRHFAVICGNWPGSSRHAGWFWGSSSWIYRVLRDKYGYPDEAIYFLHDDPKDAAQRNEAEKDPAKRVTVDGQANLENFRDVCKHLASIVKDGDQVTFYMIGHAMCDGKDSHYGFSGPALSGQELGTLMDAIPTKNIQAVFSPCQTEGFIWKASKPGRVIIVSTRAKENNSAGVAEAGIRGFEDMKCDQDGDGRLSFFEAYQNIVKEQREWYERNKMKQREHALIDDDGDGKGHYLPDEPDSEGALAKKTFLGDEGKPIRVAPEAVKALQERNKALKLDHTVPVRPLR